MINSYGIACVVTSRALLAAVAPVAPVVIGAVIALAITHGARWKVSLHLGGIAGSVTAFVLLFGPTLLHTGEEAESTCFESLETPSHY